jgi:DNA-directed RNA polymerase subunit RPC12/RpoP
MDIVFNCPECQQELAVDNSGAGSEIECPTCGGKITVPPAPPPNAAAPAPPAAEQTASPIAASAAAKVEMHLKVPVRDKPGESLIGKPPPPLEVAAKESDRKIRTKTIRRTDCVDVGHDHFDESVSGFLGKIGESNIISINPINYTIIDIGSQKLLTDYGVFIVYRG